MHQIGVVIELNGDKAKLRFKRSKACANCKVCMSAGAEHAIVEIQNTIGAKVGDSVEIMLHSRNIVKASVIAYGIPLILLLLGVALGSQWGDWYAAGTGIVFALAGFGVLRLLELKFARMGEFKPRMIRIVDAEEQEAE